MHLTKMRGLGNDHLYVCGEVPGDIAELSRKLANRHFAAGSDGMIIISPPLDRGFQDADLQCRWQRGEDVRQRDPLRRKSALRHFRRG